MLRHLERIVLYSTVALATVGFMLAMKQLLYEPPQRDFDAYYSAARMANAHLPLYAPPPDSIMGPVSPSPPRREYVYPPLLAGLLRPLAALPYRTASLLWLVVNVLLAGTVVLVPRRFSDVARRHAWWTLGAVLALPATYITWIDGMFVGAQSLLCGAEALRPRVESGTHSDIVAGLAFGALLLFLLILLVAALSIVLQRFGRELLIRFGSTGPVLVGACATIILPWTAPVRDFARPRRLKTFAARGPAISVSA